MDNLKKYKKYFFIPIAIFVGILFCYITLKTPLAGDDWGYALNGMKKNPFIMAMNFYSSWSGRFFSELWGFLAAPHKWIWNIVNPLLYVIIFLCIYKISNVKKHDVLIPLMILAIMLSVDDQLRMETYTWLMGTTYTIPLALAMVYFVIQNHLMFKTKDIDKKNKLLAYASNFILFYIGLTMENIAAMMIVAVVLLIAYAYFNKKELMPYLCFNLASSVIAFLIMRMSPGSSARLIRDNAEWAGLSLFEKLASGYPNFIEFTFIRNNYLILFISLSLVIFIIGKNTLPKYFKYISIVILFVAIFAVFSFAIIKEQNIFIDSSSLFSMLFWPAYTLDVLAIIFMGFRGEKQARTMFMFMMAGGCNLVMLYSPIFGARSSLYTVYFLIPVICSIIEETDMNKYIAFFLIVMCLGVNFDRVNEYFYKYRLVGKITAERSAQIKYYQEHPEVEEVWIRRYPIYTIHGADIEEGDDYHFDTFKEYYHLPQSSDKITFYYQETEN